MIGNLFGPDAMIVAIVAVVLLVGVNKLPKIARNIASAGKEFKKAQGEADKPPPVDAG